MLFIKVKGAYFGTGMQVLIPFYGGIRKKLIWIYGMTRHYFREEVFCLPFKSLNDCQRTLIGGPIKRKNE